MNDIGNVTPELIEQLRERSRTGYLNQIINQVTPIKVTETKVPELKYEELISSVFDD